ncbi:hypothetical protein RRG08_018368 [Elysia crispata]|uniref:Uncharacterized protein n=1 Tax=Elysia crispata TaxID=231223 RepID=A0AAE0YL92_9GAST|nr:hypothetical protein RRG08_018368 [Elysia crispata]
MDDYKREIIELVGDRPLLRDPKNPESVVLWPREGENMYFQMSGISRWLHDILQSAPTVPLDLITTSSYVAEPLVSS